MKFSCLALASFFLSIPSTVLAHHVKEDLTVTWEVGSPDGNAREMIFVNGQMPGPPLVFDEDDDVEIHVHNTMPFNCTVHWHGLE